MSVHILGGGKTGVVDLGQKQQETESVSEWATHSTNAGMRTFVKLLHEAVKEKQEVDPVTPEDVAVGYIAGFLSGITLLQGVFLGSMAMDMAKEAFDAIEQYYEDRPDELAGLMDSRSKQPEQHDVDNRDACSGGGDGDESGQN